MKIRLLILSSEFPPGPGGIGTHAYQIARELQRNGWAVLVITPQDYADEDEITVFNYKQAFEIVRLNHKKIAAIEGIYRIWWVIRWIRTWSPDIVFTTGERSAWIGALLAQLTRKPWVSVGHGTEFGKPLTPEKRLTRWAFNQANEVICVSRYTSTVMHQLGISPKKECVIPNGADDEMFYPDEKGITRSILTEIGIQKDSIILLTVGNATRRKGQEIAIRAMPAILKRFPKTEYLIAGLPTEKSRLEQLAIDLGVQQKVHFLGRVQPERLRSLYQVCDLFLMASQKLADGDFEGFGISVIEAALCGKPAVVSKGSGLEEAVVDRVTGFCVPESDPEKTADAVIALLEQPELQIQMGEAALQRAKEGYTWKIVGKKYRECIGELVENWRGEV